MTSQYLGLPMPNERMQHNLPKQAWVFKAAIEARSRLLQRSNTELFLYPISSITEEVAREWCAANRHGLLPDDANDLAWFTGAITEILALDPVTREFLRSASLPVPACGWCRRRTGGRA